MSINSDNICKNEPTTTDKEIKTIINKSRTICYDNDVIVPLECDLCRSSHLKLVQTNEKISKESTKPLNIDYNEILKQIEHQNRFINVLKLKIIDIAFKACKSSLDQRNLKQLRCSLKKQKLKLQSLIRQIVCLQEEDPYRTWEPIPLVTTLEEDALPIDY